LEILCSFWSNGIRHKNFLRTNYKFARKFLFSFHAANNYDLGEIKNPGKDPLSFFKKI